MHCLKARVQCCPEGGANGSHLNLIDSNIILQHNAMPCGILCNTQRQAGPPLSFHTACTGCVFQYCCNTSYAMRSTLQHTAAAGPPLSFHTACTGCVFMRKTQESPVVSLPRPRRLTENILLHSSPPIHKNARRVSTYLPRPRKGPYAHVVSCI